MSDNPEVQVKQMLARLSGLELDEIGDDDELIKDLGIDSLKVIEIATELEKNYKIVVADEQLQNLITVNDTVKLLEGLLKPKEANG